MGANMGKDYCAFNAANGVLVVQFTGEVYRGVLREVPRAQEMVLDLHGAAIDSSGIAEIVTASLAAKREGSHFALTGVSYGVERTLCMMNLRQYVAICKSIDDAMKKVV